MAEASDLPGPEAIDAHAHRVLASPAIPDTVTLDGGLQLQRCHATAAVHAQLASWWHSGIVSADFYSDRVFGRVPRTGEDITIAVWQGLVSLITRRIDDGSLAMEFPARRCPDLADAITGTDAKRFEMTLNSLVPLLREESPAPPGEIFNLDDPPSTPVALDVVEFVAPRIAEPSDRLNIRPHVHEHLSFARLSKHDGRERFCAEVDQIFSRNGLAFKVDLDGRVSRLGPPEARHLLSEFAPRTGDPSLDDKLTDAAARFVSRHLPDRLDGLEKLWDGFERLKTLELGGQKKDSIQQLIDRAARSPFREYLAAESRELTKIGNEFHIRHFEHDKAQLPAPVDNTADYLFTRLLAFVTYLLRQTGRL